MTLEDVTDLRLLRRRPSSRRQALLDAQRAGEAAHHRDDPVVQAATDADHLELLHVLREQLAREAAGLAFERINGNRAAEERAKLASRRIRALRGLADATLEIHRAEAGSASPTILRGVVESLRVEIIGATREVLDATAAERLAVALQERWDEALDRVIDNDGTPSR